MKNNIKTFFRVACILIIASLLLFQVYIAVIKKEGSSPLPPLFGNFPANRMLLEKQGPKNDFSFAVIGDTRSHGIFETIAEELRAMPLDFAVLLGDCTFVGTEEAHQYFRAIVVKVGKDFISERIIPCSEVHDYEDYIEDFVITEAWPWMTRNSTLVYLLDLACVVLLSMLLKPFAMGILKRLRRTSGV